MKDIPQKEFLKLISTMLEKQKEELDDKFIKINREVRIIKGSLKLQQTIEKKKVFENITRGNLKTVSIQTVESQNPEILNEIMPQVMDLCRKYKIKTITAFYE